MRNPQPLNTTFSQAYDATQWKNVCPGYGPSSSRNLSQGQDYTLDEDCLTISVIRPAGTSEGDKLPVLFWIYGERCDCFPLPTLTAIIQVEVMCL